MNAKTQSNSTDREIVMTRTFDAPRELVWKAWTDPQQIVKWWGPNGFTDTLYEMEVRPGGVWHHLMHGPDGTDYPNKVVYLEVVQPERLVYSHGGDKAGHPCQFHVTVTFEAVDDKTKLAMRLRFETVDEYTKTVDSGAIEGGNQTLGRLAEHLKILSRQIVTVRRHFEASPEEVLNAWLDPEKARKFLFTTPTSQMVRAEIDARVGGSFLFVDKREGIEIEHTGKYLEINRPHRLVFSLIVPHLSKESTVISIDIVPQKTGCNLTLTHEGVLPDYTSRITEGWGKILENSMFAVTNSNNREFTITRTFDAPREIVWKAWTDPKLFSQWFGPKGFTSKVYTLDLRAGGMLHTCLKSPDGHEMWAKFVYREVTPPSRLVWEHSFSDQEGGITRHPGHKDWPLKLLTTVTLEAIGDQTKLTLTWIPLDATEIERKTFEEGIPGMNQGWSGTFEQLTAFLTNH